MISTSNSPTEPTGQIASTGRAVVAGVGLALLGNLLLFVALVVWFVSQLTFFGEPAPPMSTEVGAAITVFTLGGIASWIAAGAVATRIARRPMWWPSFLGPGLIAGFILTAALLVS